MSSKILFILHLPPPVHGASVMGKYIQDSTLINLNHHCTYINLATAKDFSDISKFRLKKVLSLICLLIKIFQQVRKERPNLVYITPNAKGGPFYKDFIVVQFLKLLNCKIVAHYHNKGVKNRQDNILDNFLYQQFFKNLKVILLSEILYQDIAKYVDRKNVFICPNGIPETSQAIQQKRNDKMQILYLSNLQKEKGIMDVLDACSILKDKGYDFTCNIIGSETAEMSGTMLTEEINTRNLKDKVYYCGKKYGEEKDAFYKETDIFVFPTYYHNECFPVVLLEAMQHECACISTNEGGIANIIDHGKNGYIVEKRNPAVLASTIEELMNHPERMRDMGKAGREKFLAHFTLDQYEQNIHSILKELTQE